MTLALKSVLTRMDAAQLLTAMQKLLSRRRWKIISFEYFVAITTKTF